MTGLNASLFSPLVFDPGTDWGCGIGIDWVGRAIEAIDRRTIDQLCTKEIFEPLGMRNTTFEVSDRARKTLASVYTRAESGDFIEIPFSPPERPEFYGMGGALYSTAPDYMRFLRSFLQGGALDGERILSTESIELMLDNQTRYLTLSPMTLAIPPVGLTFEMLPGVPKSHTMGFMRTEDDAPGMRGRGSLGWCGLLNTHFWFDPKASLAALFMTQVAPLADFRVRSTYADFERGVCRSIMSVRISKGQLIRHRLAHVASESREKQSSRQGEPASRRIERVDCDRRRRPVKQRHDQITRSQVRLTHQKWESRDTEASKRGSAYDVQVVGIESERNPDLCGFSAAVDKIPARQKTVDYPTDSVALAEIIRRIDWTATAQKVRRGDQSVRGREELLTHKLRIGHLVHSRVDAQVVLTERRLECTDRRIERDPDFGIVGRKLADIVGDQALRKHGRTRDTQRAGRPVCCILDQGFDRFEFVLNSFATFADQQAHFGGGKISRPARH